MSKELLNRSKLGFTLPTVMIVSIIMFGVLALAMQLVSQSSSSLRDIYYNQLAREAVESGAIHAQECLRLSGYVASWTAAKPLMPDTDCYGNVVPGQLKYLFSGDGIRTLYKVSVLSGGHFASTGVTEIFSADSGSISRHYSWSDKMHFSQGSSPSVPRAVFGFSYRGRLDHSNNGVYVGAIDSSGQLMMSGANRFGQLGVDNFPYANQVKPLPVRFRLPTGVNAEKAFTDTRGFSNRTFVAGSDGNLYAAGYDRWGELGIGESRSGSTDVYVPMPRKVQLPPGSKVKHVTIGQLNSYIILENHDIYATGSCSYGALGKASVMYSGSGGSCDTSVNIAKVDMPPPTTDLTRPVLESSSARPDNIVTSGKNVFVRTIGGAVYGWGINDGGQLGPGYDSQRPPFKSKPIRIGSFGDPGSPRATSIAYVKNMLYILGDNGKLYVTGNPRTSSGWDPGVRASLALGASAMLKSGYSYRCLAYKGPNQPYGMSYCDHTDQSQRHTLRPDGKIESGGYCLSRSSSSIVARDCSSAGSESVWNYKPGDYGASEHENAQLTIGQGYNMLSSSSGSLLTANQYMSDEEAQWQILPLLWVSEVPTPEGAKVVSFDTSGLSTSVVLENGEVWSSGLNWLGQLGVGSPIDYRDGTVVDDQAAFFNLRKMLLPAGRKAISVFASGVSDESEQRGGSTYVTLDDGTIYGVGANFNNELGLEAGTLPNCSDYNDFCTSPLKMQQLPNGVHVVDIQGALGVAIMTASDGSIYILGSNRYQVAGDGSSPYYDIFPAKLYPHTVRPVAPGGSNSSRLFF